MTKSQSAFDNLQAVSEHVLSAICHEIPEYAALADSVKDSLVLTNVETTRLFLEVVVRRRMPDPSELGWLAEAARERVHQGVPLQALLRAYRVGARAMWEQVSRQRSDLDPVMLADSTLRYIDCTSSAAELAYTAERERLLNSQSEATRLLLARIVEGDFPDASAGADAARALALDPAQFHVGVVIGASDPAPNPSVVDTELGRVLEEVRRRMPAAVSALLRRGAVILVPAGYTAGVESLIESSLDHAAAAPGSLTAGIGRPTRGEAGLTTTIQEAERSRTLGSILFPGRRVHEYESVSFFDLFRQGDIVHGFVHAVLGRFADHDRGGRTNLVRTLYVYFTLGMNRKATATRLGIHPNTLDYRLRQAVQVGGIDVASPENSFRFQLAVRLLPICSQAVRLGDGSPLADLDIRSLRPQARRRREPIS